MSIKKVMKGVPTDYLAAQGLFKHDHEAITPCQRECTSRMAMTIQLEQEAYITQHPELIAMVELFMSNEITKMKRQTNFIKDAAEFFLRPFEELDQDIRNRLGVGPGDPYIPPDKKAYWINDNLNLETDLRNIVAKHYPPPPWSYPPSGLSSDNTDSSSFLTVFSSNTTVPTPVPEPTPEMSLEQHFYNVVSNTVDKAIYLNVTEPDLLYDTAWVELVKAVEAAMEITVTDIKLDIADLFYNAYKLFELDILEKQRVAAEKAWEKRMRKKLKRTIRRQMNYKGYETPPTPKMSVASSHESYKVPPPRPCKCHPQWHYNRYDKDRFGIYLPQEPKHIVNSTVTPVLSVESLVEEEVEEENDNKTDAKSTKSTVSKTK